MPRTILRCKNCGKINNNWHSEKYATCFHCGSSNHEKVEYPAWVPTESEKKECSDAKKKLIHILEVSLRKIRPGKDDYFGCVEMCDYLKEKFGLTNEIYELAAYINSMGFGSVKCVEKEYYWFSDKAPVILPDGRIISYSLVSYSREKALGCDIPEEAMDNDPAEVKRIFPSIVAAMRKEFPFTYGNSNMDGVDYTYDLETLKKARTKVIDYLEGEKKKEREEAEWTRTKNRFIAEITKPVQITDPNYVKEATCPNCHKNTVYRISNTKRAASVGLWGLLSKNIGKTMECKYCGHRW